MKIVFIGAGSVATSMAIEAFRCGFKIEQVYSRTNESAIQLAKIINAQPISNLSEITSNADVYIFAVKDYVLESIIKKIKKNVGLWLHTSGSIPITVFEPYSSNYGVLYPFQTFTKNRQLNWKEIPIFIEGVNNQVCNSIQEIAESFSHKVLELNSENRKYVHLSGIFVSNFSNHMYTLAQEFMQKANLPFELTLPLIEETCHKIHSIDPIKAQTGPAVRNDKNIIDQHLAMIENALTKTIYSNISTSIYLKQQQDNEQH